MATLSFFGAAGTVTGSCTLLDTGEARTLVDCGLFQGNRATRALNDQPFPFDAAAVDVVLLTHAHTDHTGLVPKLVKAGFAGEILATDATADLLGFMMEDSARIQESSAERDDRRRVREGKAPRGPLYTVEHAREALGRLRPVAYDEWTSPVEGVEARWLNAGHILGSASIELRCPEPGTGRTLRLLFSGDLGPDEKTFHAPPDAESGFDYVISESTYGDREHEDRPAEKGRFLEIIRDTCERRGGKLLIPAFSVGRTQELVYLLDQLENEGALSSRIPVYVDSPLAINATTIYGNHPECYDSDLHEYLLTDPNPFGFNTLHYTRKVEESKAINDFKGPAIIISASGMANAGRIKHHLNNHLADPKSTAFIVGYCAPGTPGAALRDGAASVKLFGEEVPVRAKVEVMDSFSAHADRLELRSFLQNQKAARLFLVHGEESAQLAFADELGEHGHGEVTVPRLRERFELR